MKVLGGRFLREDELRALGIGHAGRNVLVHDSCNIVGLENLHLGDHVRIDAFTSIAAGRGRTEIGSYVHIGSYCYLGAGHGLVMEDFSGLSQGVKIYTASDDYSGATLTNPTVPDAYKTVKAGAVRLGRHAIVGAGTVILPKTDVGEGCSVGALSLVTHSLAPWGIYAGTPAKRIRERKRDLLALEQRLLADTAGN